MVPIAKLHGLLKQNHFGMLGAAFEDDAPFNSRQEAKKMISDIMGKNPSLGDAVVKATHVVVLDALVRCFPAVAVSRRFALIHSGAAGCLESRASRSEHDGELDSRWVHIIVGA